MATCNWPLGDGGNAECGIYEQGANWSNAGGIYIFAYQTDDTHWSAVYVGQTDDFSSRIPYHEHWTEAVRLGATHVHAMIVRQAATRDNLEAMLIQNLQPPLNDLLR